MAEIIKVYSQKFPSFRLIGKRYFDWDRGPLGGFGSLWEDWFQKQYSRPLQKLAHLPENEGAYVGCMRYNEGMEYWTGMFFSVDTPVPDGYQYIDIPEGNLGACWIRGNANNGELYGENVHNLCVSKLEETGLKVDKNKWFFERYVYPRFVIPDENGKVILDYCIYLIDDQQSLS